MAHSPKANPDRFCDHRSPNLLSNTALKAVNLWNSWDQQTIDKNQRFPYFFRPLSLDMQIKEIYNGGPTLHAKYIYFNDLA